MPDRGKAGAICRRVTDPSAPLPDGVNIETCSGCECHLYSWRSTRERMESDGYDAIFLCDACAATIFAIRVEKGLDTTIRLPTESQIAEAKAAQARLN